MIIPAVKSKENDLKYGLAREEILKNLLEKVFHRQLIHSHFKYSCFDYYDKRKHFIFEIKNYRYAYSKYKTEIIGCNKGLSDNAIFIFQHEDKDIYFIRFNKILFDTFNTRYINVPYRINAVLCYDIPKQYLTKIDINNLITYKLKSAKGETKKIKKIIEDDILTQEKQNIVNKLNTNE
jgi:hypothetical protein